MENGHQTCASLDPEQLKRVGEAYRLSLEALGSELDPSSREEAERYKHDLARVLLEVAANGEENPRRMSLAALQRMPPRASRHA